MGKCKDFFRGLDDKNILLHWWGSQPKGAKLGLAAAALFATLTHMAIYSNLVIEEHVLGFYKDHGPDPRWLQPYINRLSFYYLHWGTGLLQVLFIALSAFYLIKALEMKNTLVVLIFAGIMATQPNIAETNLHFHDAATYMFALLLACVAFYGTKQYKWGWLPGAVLVMLSLAIYQAKVSVAMVASLVAIMLYIYEHRPSVAKLVAYASRYLLLIGIGFVLYAISLHVFGVDIAAAHGHLGLEMNTLWGTIAQLPRNMFRAYHWLFHYFFSFHTGSVRSFRFPSAFLLGAYITLLVIVVFSLGTLVVAVWKKRVFHALVILFLCALIPIAINYTLLVEGGAIITISMTTYAVVLVYVLPFIIWDKVKVNTFGLKPLASVPLVFLIGYYVMMSNYMYLRGIAATDRVIHLTNRLAVHVEALLPHAPDNQVMIVGSLRDNPMYPARIDFLDFTPRTTNTANVTFWGRDIGKWPENLYVRLMRYRLGLDLHTVHNARQVELLDMAIQQGMPVFPAPGSFQVIDGVVVGVLNFYGRVDVQEVTLDRFAATIYHTGREMGTFVYTWYLYQDGVGEWLYHDTTGGGDVVFDMGRHRQGAYQLKVVVYLPGTGRVLTGFSPVFQV